MSPCNAANAPVSPTTPPTSSEPGAPSLILRAHGLADLAAFFCYVTALQRSRLPLLHNFHFAPQRSLWSQHTPAQFQRLDGRACQGTQHFALAFAEYAWLEIDHTQRSHHQPVAARQWRARVKADMWRASDQRIVGKARILLRIRNLQHIVLRELQMPGYSTRIDSSTMEVD